MAYLALTGRLRAAAVAAGTFAVTVAAGFGGLPGPSRTFWLGGVFYDQSRIGDPANPSDQSLAGAVARLAGTGDPPRVWWLVAVLAVGLAGLAVAVWAHRRGYRMAGLLCCAVTGLLVSPISWTHHWVWAVPLLVWLTAAAWRRRSAAWALAAAAAAAVFSDYTPLPWPRASGRPGADGSQRPVRAVRPGRAGGGRRGAGPARRTLAVGRRIRRYRSALTRAISLSMSEDSVGLGDVTFSSWLSIM